jgi:F-type H+-transporting ATPase subunit gamma
MATLRDIKARIIGVKNTQQITKAMKMVAAARLRRAQENMINARPYSNKIAEVLSNLFSIEKDYTDPLIEEREVEKISLVAVTSDRGLCGAFNMNVIRRVEELIKEEYAGFYSQGNLSLYCIGKKGAEYFGKRNYEIAGSYTGIFSDLNFDFSAKFVADLKSRFEKRDVDKVIVVYNEFKSVIQQKIMEKQLLPIEKISAEEDTLSNLQMIYEPDKVSIISSLLPKYLNTAMWKILLESYAAELGARMTAMDMATENAKDIIRSLNITYNKERQASITKEILEIVSGANALRGSQ